MAAEVNADDRRIVAGWAIVSSIDGRPYVDTDGDWIPDEVLLDAAVDYHRSGGVVKLQHGGEQIGEAIGVWPATDEIMERMGFAGRMTGLMLLARVSETAAGDAVLERFARGELPGFSIGGQVVSSEVMTGEDAIPESDAGSHAPMRLEG